ncbi:hypothetical protein PENTCL1PPCAC_13414, partial [Pristionchus entomophagus]
VVVLGSECVCITVEDLSMLEQETKNSGIYCLVYLDIDEHVALDYADQHFGLHPTSFDSDDIVRTNAEIEISGNRKGFVKLLNNYKTVL